MIAGEGLPSEVGRSEGSGGSDGGGSDSDASASEA
jgi:hypothetical protein